MTRILLVDDDPSIRAMFSMVLKSQGFDVLTADNGQTALEVLQSCHELPALILLDLMMPLMSGAEFRVAQRADPRLASIPTVVVSAAGDVPSHMRSMIDIKVCPKPVSMDGLLAVVSDAGITSAIAVGH